MAKYAVLLRYTEKFVGMDYQFVLFYLIFKFFLKNRKIFYWIHGNKYDWIGLDTFRHVLGILM